MFTGGLAVLVGVACGLRLTLLPFVLVMLSILAALALDAAFAERPSLVTSMAEWVLAWFSIQLGYASGILIRHFE
jgi:hypothetical protein